MLLVIVLWVQYVGVLVVPTQEIKEAQIPAISQPTAQEDTHAGIFATMKNGALFLFEKIGDGLQTLGDNFRTKDYIIEP